MRGYILLLFSFLLMLTHAIAVPTNNGEIQEASQSAPQSPEFELQETKNLQAENESLIAQSKSTNLYLHGFSIQSTRVYDGTVTISITNFGTLNTQEDGNGDSPENVGIDTASASATVNSANAGSGKAVTVEGITLSGDDKDNYNLILPTGLTTNILPRPVSHNGLMTIHDKPYDGTTTAEIDDWGALDANGVIGDDDVSLLEDPNVTTAEFEDAEIGENKTVYVYNLALTGDQAHNYTFSSPPLPPGHGGGDDFSPPDLYSSASITQAEFSNILIEGPTTITAGETSNAFTLYAQDLFGNNVEMEEETTITLTSSSGSSDEAISFDPEIITLAIGDVSATFTYMDQKSGTHTITATVSTGSSKQLALGNLRDDAISGSISITVNHATATKLRFKQQPTETVAGEHINPDVTVYIEDVFGNTATGNSNTINMSLYVNPFNNKGLPGNKRGPAMLKGTLNQDAVEGVATFNDLNIELADQKYRLDAISSGLASCQSEEFDIIPAATHELIFSSVPTGYTAGNPRVKYTLLRRDIFGNHAIDGEFTAYLYHDSGENMAAFHGSESNGDPITSITIENGQTSADFWYSDKKAGERLITASDNSSAPDGDTGIHDATHTLTINPKPITIRVEDNSRIYGYEYEQHSFRDFSGQLMDGDKIKDITGGSGENSDVTFSAESDAGSPVGVYPSDIGIVSSSLDGDRVDSYSISIIRGMTTITRKDMSIGGSLTAHDKTYDAQADAVIDTSELTLEGKVNGDEVSLVDVVAAFAESGVGTHSVSITSAAISGADAGNYNFTYTDAPKTTAEIFAATLTITADDQTKVVDGVIFPVDEYTVSYEGFVAGEGTDVLIGDLNFGGEAGTATAVGTYTITVSGPTADNYAITFVDGKLEITEKRFVFHIEPVNTTAGETINGTEGTILTVHIVGEDNDILDDANDLVTIAIRNNPAGGTLSGTLSKQAENGVVTFDDLSVVAAGVGYTLRVTAPNVTSATSDPFDIEAATAYELLFTQAPETAVAGVESLGFTVQVRDIYDNLTTVHDGFTDIISVSDEEGTLNPAEVNISGDASGVGFEWQPPTDVGTYTLTLNAGIDFEVIHHEVNIAHAPASQWHFATSFPLEATAGEAFEPSAIIHVTDDYENLATSYSGQHFVAALTDEASGALNGNPVAAITNGIATFGQLSYEIAETITLVFTCSDESIEPATEGSDQHAIDVAANLPATIALLQHPIHPNNIFNAGEILTPNPVVEVKDAYGNLVPGIDVQAVINKPEFTQDAVTTVPTAADGRATFGELKIATAGNDFQVSFKADGSDGEVTSTHFSVHIRASTPATTAIIAGPTATIPQQWSDDYTLILLDEYDNESYALGNMVFDMHSTSGKFSFRSGRSDDIMIPSGQASTTFQYKDEVVGQQTITASWSYQEIDPPAKGCFVIKGRPMFEDANYLVDVSDQWVWMASTSKGSGNDWGDLSNWNQTEGSPGSENTVFIRNYHADIWPRIEGSEHEIGTIVIESGLGIVLAPDASLGVADFVIDADLKDPIIHIESDASGTGSLINDTKGVIAQVQRYVSGNSNDWHMLSSPVKAQRIDGEGTSDFTGSGFYAWYEPMQTWVSFHNHSHIPTWSQANSIVGGATNTFIPAKGYMTAHTFEEGQNPTLLFEGELGVQTNTFNLMRYAHPDDNFVGFNLLGNPYPSAIDWQAEEGWSGREHLEGDEHLEGYNMWIWNPEVKNYGVYNTMFGPEDLPEGWDLNGISNVIPAMQAFWVRAAEGNHGKTIGMDSSVRVHGDQAWHKGGGSLSKPSLHLSLALDGTALRDEALLQFGHASDRGGAEKMFSMNPQAPGLYTVKHDKNFTISFLTNTDDHRLVPLAFEAGRNDTYTLSIKGVNSFCGEVWLSDLLTGREMRLWEGYSYEFTAKASDSPDRFVLRFGLSGDDDTTDVNEPAITEAHIYYYVGMLHVANPWQDAAEVQIFDSRGRLSDRFRVDAHGTTDRRFSREPGVYVVRMQSGRNSHVVRIVVAK